MNLNMSITTICSSFCQGICEGDSNPDKCQDGCMKGCNSSLPSPPCQDYCKSQCAAATTPACMGYCLWSKPCPAGLNNLNGSYPSKTFNPPQPKPSQSALIASRMNQGINELPLGEPKIENYPKMKSQSISTGEKAGIFFGTVLLVILIGLFIGWLIKKKYY